MMRRLTKTLALAAMAPLLTGCVILPAMVHGAGEERTTPDKPAYLEAVSVEFDTDDEFGKDLALEVGEQICRLHEGGMSEEAVIVFLEETAYEADADLNAGVLVEAAFMHLC